MQRKRSGVLVLGDLHGEWSVMAELIAEHAPELVFMAGDLDYIPGYGPWSHFLKAYTVPKSCTIRFV